MLTILATIAKPRGLIRVEGGDWDIGAGAVGSSEAPGEEGLGAKESRMVYRNEDFPRSFFFLRISKNHRKKPIEIGRNDQKAVFMKLRSKACHSLLSSTIYKLSRSILNFLSR